MPFLKLYFIKYFIKITNILIKKKKKTSKQTKLKVIIVISP